MNHAETAGTDSQKRRRLEALIEGRLPDRTPVLFWRHFPAGGTGRELARGTAWFYRRYDADAAKVMPDIPFTMPLGSVTKEGDWDYVQVAGPDRSRAAAEYVLAARETRRLIGPEAPLLVTLFTPLMYAFELRGLDTPERLLEDSPPRVHHALEALAASVIAIGRALLAAGADGIYLSVWGADVLPPAAFAEFGRPYDLAVVDALREGALNILHVHGGPGLRLEQVADYPLPLVSWSSMATGISLEEGLGRLGGRVPVGGAPESGTAVTAEGADELATALESTLVWAQARQQPMLLAPGCSLPDQVPDSVLDALRQAVGT